MNAQDLKLRTKLMELLPENKIELELIHKEANEILSIIVASLKTARNNP